MSGVMTWKRGPKGTGAQMKQKIMPGTVYSNDGRRRSAADTNLSPEVGDDVIDISKGILIVTFECFWR